jgi:hypothetical protein
MPEYDEAIMKGFGGSTVSAPTDLKRRAPSANDRRGCAQHERALNSGEVAISRPHRDRAEIGWHQLLRRWQRMRRNRCLNFID